MLCLVASADASLPQGHYFGFERNWRDAGTPRNDLIPFGTPIISEDPLGVVTGMRAAFLDGSARTSLQFQFPIVFRSDEAWALAWWARRASLGTSSGMIIGTADSPGDFVWLNDSQRGLRFRNSEGRIYDFYAPKDSGMRHYALVADGQGALTLYLDGKESEVLAADTAFQITALGNGFPTTNSNFNFHGWLDDVRIFRDSLTPEMVKLLYEMKDERVVEGPDPERLLVFLIGGQSNAVGHGPASDLSREAFFPQEDVDFFYHLPDGPFEHVTVRPGGMRNGSFGPEISMARRLADLFEDGGRTRVSIIKYARGGTNLHTQWAADGSPSDVFDGPEYRVFQETVRRGLVALQEKYPEAELEIAGMAWMQGEADRDPRYNPFYQANLERFILDLRKTYRSDLPVVIGRLSINQRRIPTDELEAIRRAQDGVGQTDPLIMVVDTDEMPVLPDDLHFDAEGLLEMGKQFAEALSYLFWVREAFNLDAVGVSQVTPDALFPGEDRTNYSRYVLDWPDGDPEFEHLIRMGGLKVHLLNPSSAELEFLSSARRLHSIEIYDFQESHWTAMSEPKRGIGGSDLEVVSIDSLPSMFRLRVLLPDSSF